MALKDRKITEAGIAQHGVVSAPDRLTGTAAENKKVFDKLVRNVVAEQVNGLVDDLSAKTAGASGISQLGMTPIAGLNAANAQVALEELKNWLEQAIIGAGGVLSYNGRRGAVKPQSGDYTAAMVGAAPVLQLNNTLVHLYVSPDGNDATGDGTAEKPYRQIQRALDTLPKNLGYNSVQIHVAPGGYAGFEVSGFYGGRSNSAGISIIGDSADTTTITGAVFVASCSYVNFEKLHFTNGMSILATRFFRMFNSTVDGTATETGIWIQTTNTAMLNTVTVKDKTKYAINVDGSMAFLSNISGANGGVGLLCGNDSTINPGFAIITGFSMTGNPAARVRRGGVIIQGTTFVTEGT